MSPGATPLTRFKTVIENIQAELNEELEEIKMTADLLSSRPNYLTVDESGYYHVQASGNIDEVIYTLQELLNKLGRIKSYRDQT